MMVHFRVRSWRAMFPQRSYWKPTSLFKTKLMHDRPDSCKFTKLFPVLLRYLSRLSSTTVRFATTDVCSCPTEPLWFTIANRVGVGHLRTCIEPHTCSWQTRRQVNNTFNHALFGHKSDQNFATLVHGGLILSLTDTLGSLAVATKGHYMTGVSTDIGTSFVRPAGRVGDVLHAKSVLTGMGGWIRYSAVDNRLKNQVGKQLAYTRTDFTNEAGELVAYGCRFSCCQGRMVDLRTSIVETLADHTKYVGRSSSHEVSFQPSSKHMRCSKSALWRSLQENVKFSEDGETVIEGKPQEEWILRYIYYWYTVTRGISMKWLHLPTCQGQQRWPRIRVE